MARVFFCACFILLSNIAIASGPYTSKISMLQTTAVGSGNNTVFLVLDIVDSPCAGTNTYNRFAIVNNAQQSVVLAAVMTDKEITIYGKGTCNGSQNEPISALRIKP
jgi:hypothetical protein